ncbi:50S ribosomal protein L3 [Escherichia coli]|nr:50S ribosomal protein L3 [Escherichia coli]
MIGLVGKKVGMTRIFTEDGVSIPVTVIEVEANRVTQVKDLANDGYRAIQVTTGAKKANRVTKPEAGHFAKAGVEAGRGLWEFRLAEGEEFTVGQSISVELFADVKKVDVTGTSKGKVSQVPLSAGTSVPRTLLTVTPCLTAFRVLSVRTRLRAKCSKARKWQVRWVTNV